MREGEKEKMGDGEMGECVYVCIVISPPPPPRVTTLVNRHGDSDLREENHCARTQDLNTRTFVREYSPCVLVLVLYVKGNVRRCSWKLYWW